MRQGSADGGGVLWEARRGRESGEEAIAMVDAPRPVPRLPDRDPGLRIVPAARARGNLEHEPLRPHGVVVQLGGVPGREAATWRGGGMCSSLDNAHHGEMRRDHPLITTSWMRTLKQRLGIIPWEFPQFFQLAIGTHHSSSDQ